jgi:hypothetical protein
MFEGFDIWVSLPVSNISDHHQDCCRDAKSWFLALDISLRPNASYSLPPSWIRQRYEWGPSPWPLHWCEAVCSEKLDCGALASLARHAILARGGVVLPCQLIRSFNREAVSHWRRLWNDSGLSGEWAHGEHAYHEACAIAEENVVNIWDPTDDKWIEPYQRGYGSTAALRIALTKDWRAPQELRWGAQEIPIGTWVYLDRCFHLRKHVP